MCRTSIVGFFIVLAASCFGSISVDSGGFTYRIGGGVPDGEAELAFVSWDGKLSSSVTIPKTVTICRKVYLAGEVCETYRITSIGDEAFPGDTGIRSLTILADLRYIGSYAFYGCTNLESVTLGDVDVISFAAFANCKRLSSVNWGSVNIIEDSAFSGCGALKEWQWPAGLEYVGSSVFSGTAITNVVVPASIEFYGWTFSNCANLKSATFADGTDKVPQGMLSECVMLKEVYLPAGVTEIGDNAFSFCPILKTVELPFGVQSIGESAFCRSELFDDIELPESIVEIGAAAFSGTALRKVDLSQLPLKELEDETFSHCKDLQEVRLPPELHTIGVETFCGCSSLTNCDLSGCKVVSIGAEAFRSCNGMKNGFVFPETLEVLDDRAFFSASGPFMFLCPPPEMNFSVFEFEDKWRYKHGAYTNKYMSEWCEAIRVWDTEHETANEWHGLKFLPIVEVEPVDWEMNKPKAGDQTLTISWHVPTNDNLTVEQAMAELKAKNLTYAVWRSGDDPKEYADFRKSVCVAQNVVDVKWPDEKFGEIKGTHPVRYWVEIQEEKNAKGDPSNRKRPNAEPVFCTTRRRFGIVVGVSDYERHWWSVGTLDGYQSWASWFWLSSLPEPRKEAIKFESLMRESGAVVEEDDLLCLVDGNAQLDAVRSGWRKFSEKKEIKPGDMMFFYVSTHGEGGAGAYHGGGVMLHDHRYAKDELEEDIRMFNEKHPDVRVVNTVMACHSGGLVKAIGKNVAWIYSCGKDELSSSIGKTYSMFGTAFLEYGWEKLSANNSIVRGYWDEPCYTAPEAGDVTLFNLAEYSRRLAFGLSSKVPSHVDVLNGSLLKTINMVARRESFRENPPAPISKLEVFSADCMTCVAWTGNEDAEYYVVKYEEEESGGVDYVTINRHAGLRFETVNFQDDAKYYNPISHDKPYKISVAAVNRAGIGPFSRVVEFPNVDLPPCVYSVHEISGNAYVGSVSYPFEFSDVEVQASVADVGNADVASVEFTFSHEEGVTNFSCLASFNTNGIIMCSNEACCVYAALTPKYICGTVNGFHFAARNVDCEIETLGSAYSCGEEIAITCISKINDGVFHAKNMPKGLSLDLTTGVISGIPTVPGSYVVLVTVKSKTDPTQTETIEVPIVIGNYVDETIAVDDEYGPFVPGEKVELKFPEGAAWKVTGLPTGLKWDSKLPGVTGVPTKPGTNTVYFTWTDKTVTPNVTHKASSTFIVGPLPVDPPVDPVDPVDPPFVPPTLVDETGTVIDVEKGESAPYEKAAAAYDGYVVQDGVVKGTIQVKVAKAKVKKAKKSKSKVEGEGEGGGISAAVTATVQLAGGMKKLSFKGGVADEYGNVTEMSAGGHTLALSLGVNGMGGSMDGVSVDGARNVFSSKDPASKATASAIEKAWVGAINVVGDDVALAVSVAKKGKVKVSGTVNGAKVTATSQLIVGADACCVPVVITKKANLAFNLWLMDDGTVEIVGLDGAVVGKAGTLKSGAVFAFGEAAAKGLAALPRVLTQYLPTNLVVAVSGKKWVVAPDAKGKAAKAGKVTFNKNTGVIDEAKLGVNPSALKLTYTAKTGSFKGSFKAYTIDNNKVKAYTFNITGVMIGDTGYGTATLKKPAISIPIVIE